MPPKSVKDYYAILGVPSNAGPEEIRLAYRREARAHHPDRNDAPDAEERFKEINEAYEILADPQQRKAYDFFVGTSGEVGTPPPPPSDAEPQPSPADPPSEERPVAPPPPRPQPEPASPPTSKPRSRPVGKRAPPPTWAILLMMLGACIIVGVGVGALLSLRRPRPSGGAESLDVTKLTTFTSPPEIPENLTVVQESGTPLGTVRPHQMDVAGRGAFNVVAVLPERGRWPVPAQQHDVATWVHGTVINYVIGVPFTETNASLLASLASGDRITLTLDNGTRLTFGSPQAQRIAANDLSPMQQRTPGLTLVMLGSPEANRLIVQARYLPEESLSSEEQRIDGVTIRVESSDVVEEVDDSLYFVVEYSVTNQSGAVVDPAFFDMTLEDSAGQRYTLNEDASSWGEYGMLDMELAPGESASGSAGYVVPREMPSPVTWIFRRDATASAAARFVLTYEPPPPAPAQPSVEVSKAFYDAQRKLIVVSGQVANTGESPLTVTLEDVTLSSSQGEGQLQTAAPLLPWTVASGSSVEFELQFSTPSDVDSVLLDILGFTFRLEGLLR
jgi:hypothetical protein